MGFQDAPQWLLSAFTRSCVAAGATAPRAQIEATADALLERWSDPSRFHHNVRHLVDMLAKVDQLAEETHHPDLVRLAAWYHGAVFSSAPSSAYAQRGGEDEAASADLAAAELTALGISEANVTVVHHIITGLARHKGAEDVDTQAMCDAELATLAVEPQKYAEYRRSIRREYAHIPMRDYLTARIAILTKLLKRKHLFASPLGQPWEQPARQNLTAELHRLKDELDRLPLDSDGGLASEWLTTELPAVPAPGGNGSAPRTSTVGTGAAAVPATPTGATTTGIPAVRVGQTDGQTGVALAVPAAAGSVPDEGPTAPAVVPPRESLIRRIAKDPRLATAERPELPGRS
jgi:predicted metal-dependent HD superfamily phosphohydrolase